MKLEESTFLLYAAKYYDNPHCHDISEFEEDLKRFQYIRKLLNRFAQYGDLKERLILNHVIVIYNCFGTNATSMLFMKLEEHHELVKPFIEFLNYMPEIIEYNGTIINSNSIISNQEITKKLQEI